MQPMRQDIFYSRPFDETFENAQWREIKPMQTMNLHKFCLYSLSIFSKKILFSLFFLEPFPYSSCATTMSTHNFEVPSAQRRKPSSCKNFLAFKERWVVFFVGTFQLSTHHHFEVGSAQSALKTSQRSGVDEAILRVTTENPNHNLIVSQNIIQDKKSNLTSSFIITRDGCPR